MKYFDAFADTPVPEGIGPSNRLKALILCRQGKVAAALPYFRKQLEYYPLSVRDWYNLSMAYLQLRQPAKARAAQDEMYKVLELKGIGKAYLPYVLKSSRYDMQPHIMYLEVPKP